MGTSVSKTRISQRLRNTPRHHNRRSCFDDDKVCNVKGAFLKISRVQVMCGAESANSWICLTDDVTSFANVDENGRLVFCNRIASVKAGRSCCSWIVETVWKTNYEFTCSDPQEAFEWRSAVLAMARRENSVAAIVSFEDKDLSTQMRKRIRRHMQNYSFMYRRPEFFATTCFGTKEDRPVMSCTSIRDPGYRTMFGYAECRNAGKSKTNEDMCAFHIGRFGCDTPYYLWIVADGHGGWDAARFAVVEFPRIFSSTAREVHRMSNNEKSAWTDTILQVSGMIEDTFVRLDRVMFRESEKRFEMSSGARMKGGCTMIVMLVSENTLWTASAGDSAAVGLSCDDDENTKSISTIHTVQGDRLRVQQLGTLRPDLLGGVFTPRMYEMPPGERRFRGKWSPDESFVGQTLLCHDHTTILPVPRIVRREDVFATTRETDRIKSKDPVITGHGDFSRILGVLRTTRGFGDFYREACHHRHVMLKPFLSACPDVRSWCFGTNKQHGFEMFSSMNFVILGSDGLWDVLSPNKAADIVRKSLNDDDDDDDDTNSSKMREMKFSTLKRDDHQSRMRIAAEKLVIHARGKQTTNGLWKNPPDGSLDDICAFVIDLAAVSSHPFMNKQCEDYHEDMKHDVRTEQIKKDNFRRYTFFPETPSSSRYSRLKKSRSTRVSHSTIGSIGKLSQSMKHRSSEISKEKRAAALRKVSEISFDDHFTTCYVNISPSSRGRRCRPPLPPQI